VLTLPFDTRMPNWPLAPIHVQVDAGAAEDLTTLAAEVSNCDGAAAL